MASIVVTRTHGNKILRIALASAPVNALTRPLVAAVRAEVAQANAAGSSVRGILFASSLSKVFSAGLDLSELVLETNKQTGNSTDRKTDNLAHKRAKVASYMGLDGFQSFVLDIASSKVPTAAAVHGACPAGGTVLALATDYKITAWPAPAKFSMGLNETRVGLAPPLWLHALARLNLASPRIAETVIQLGTLYNDPYEAQKLGFLDTVLENASLEDAEEVASARLLELASIPWEARVAAKLGARAELLALLRDPDESIVDCIVGDEFQRVTGDLLVSLKKNK